MAAAPRIYCDTNVFIAAFETVGAHSDHAWWLIDAIEQEAVIGVTSEITLAELLVNPIETGATELVEAYPRMISPGGVFEVLPVMREILIDAAGIRARRKSIKMPDAIHIATARHQSCTHFVSGDQRLELPDGMVLLKLDAFTLDAILTGGS